jgi:peptide/nickel transport system permease protein
MARYLAYRTLLALASLATVSLVIFGLLHLDAATPAAALLGLRRATPANVAALNRAMGWNLPVPVQYVHWLTSFFAPEGQGVAVLTRNLPVTLELFGLGVGTAFLLALLVGFIQVLHPGSLADRLLTALVYVLSATPGFWLALLLVWAFTLYLLWLPPPGPPLPTQMGFWWWCRFEVLPVATIALTTVGYWSRHFRVVLEEALRSDYARTARAKGVPERRVVTRHAFRNALLPLITLAGTSLPNVLNTVIAIEGIFYLNGAGNALIQAVDGLFFASATSVTMALALVAIFANLLADVAYSLVDPRIQYR